MTIRQQIREALKRNPSVKNRALAKELGCSAPMVSKVRRELGLMVRPWRNGRVEVRLPDYMTIPLMRLASEAGDDVSVEDFVIACIDDVLAGDG